jgi:lipopolysaccharide transport system ATP-binding protein
MSIAIQVENVSKQYRLGKVGTGTVAHDLNRWWHLVRGKEDPYLKIGDVNDRTVKGDSEYVWALQDINFQIEQGEAVGIIGRNGAGKSTLLKILSRTTAPTTGNLKLKGRVASLLEVGTGFHPELSGRENIYLNGAILGMNRNEISRKFDEIVDFSGVERYVDTPVKRYSSGMYVRLAFAVAAHLESEILIIDEVLAVGDAEFQKKCLGKMGQVSKGEGRTVLFVSHNMAAMQSLCSRSILLNRGSIEFQGETREIIGKYLKGEITQTSLGEVPLNYPRNKYNPGYLHINSIYAFGEDSEERDTFMMKEQITFVINFSVENSIEDTALILTLMNDMEGAIGYASTARDLSKNLIKLDNGNFQIIFKVFQLLLPGKYSLGVNFLNAEGYPYDSIQYFGEITITDFSSDGEKYPWYRNIGQTIVDSEFVAINKLKDEN